MPAISKFEYYPASPFQKAEFLKHLYAKQKIKPFNCSITSNLREIDFSILQTIFDDIIERYKIFRTTLIMEKGEILQKVWPYQNSMLNVDFIDISTVRNQVEVLNSIVFQKRYRIFFPDQYPWLDVCVIKKGERDFILFINIPHMIIDGTSIGHLKKELNMLYQAYIKEEKIVQQEVFQFGDYIKSVYEELRGKKGVEHRTFWRELLYEIPQNNLTTRFSKDKKDRIHSYRKFILNELKQVYGNISSKAQKSFWGNISYVNLKPGTAYEFLLEDDRFSVLKSISVSTNINLSAIIIAVYYLLIYRLTGEKDIIIGICTDLRERKEHKELLGFMINTVLIRQKIDMSKGISDFFMDVYTTTLKSYRHKIYPFDLVLYENDISLQSIGSLFLNIMNINSPVIEKKYEYIPEQYNEIIYNTYFDIDCLIDVFSNGIRFNCRYNPELFTRSTIEFIFNQYKSIIDELSGFLKMKIEDLFQENMAKQMNSNSI